MSKKKKDNPAAMAVMGVILAGALISVGRSLFSGDNPQAVRAAAAPAASDAEVIRVSTGALPASERDPFSSPLLQRAMLAQAGPAASPGPQTVGIASVAPRHSALVPPRTPVLTPVTPYVHVLPITPPARRPGPNATGKPSSADETALARSIRVTAIVMGAHPYAVLEPVGSTPRTLHAQESYRSLRLVVIRTGEIVLRGQFGFWTLPLATPDSETGPEEGKN